MKENGLKMIISAALTGLFAYLGNLVIPLGVLVGVIILDFITGMVKAWRAEGITSKKVFEGIVKKLCYGGLVVVGMSVDWLIISGLKLSEMQVEFDGMVAWIVAVWLIVNELISILENLYEVGVPQIPGLSTLLKKLKVSAEKLPEAMVEKPEEDVK